MKTSFIASVALALTLLFIISACNTSNSQPENNNLSAAVSSVETTPIEQNANPNSEPSNLQPDIRDPVYQYEVEHNLANISQEDAALLEKISAEEKPELKKFHYQLQDTNIDKLKNLEVKYVVVDIDDSGFSSSDINLLKKSGKKVLSYLSIGEAEDYRSYWKSGWKEGNPSFIDKENPQWKGNFIVKYWDEEWQYIMMKQLDKIIDNGYDGAYFDTVDSYWYYLEMSSVNSAEEMANMVSRLSKHAKNRNPDFMIFGQNALELYDYEKYKLAVNGIGREDLWYNDDDRQDAMETATGLKYLRTAKDDGKVIMVIDYPGWNSRICDFYERCSTEGFYCAVENRELNLDEPFDCEN